MCSIQGTWLAWLLVAAVWEANTSPALASSRLSDALTGNNSTPAPQIRVADFKIEHLGVFIYIITFLLVLIVVKVVLHHLPRLSSYVPESCLLLAMGTLSGFIVSSLAKESLKGIILNETIFMYILLPPIVLDSAYGLHSRVFYSNFGKIVCFAVLGTIASAALTALFLIIPIHVFHQAPPGENLSIKELAFFSSFIVAVDPVAVLGIFEEIGVDLALYFLVFGESLLNDAVTIVLYNIMQVFVKQDNAQWEQVVLGVVSFFTVSFGGMIVGTVFGVACCLITRFTKGMEILQPFVILLTGYAAYMFGDLFGWSALVSLICCGLIQSAYAFHNISFKSTITVKRATKVMAQMCESTIFLFLGAAVFIADPKALQVSFVGWSLLAIMLSRMLVILFFCYIINLRTQKSSHRISYREQFIMIYGGLRGVVSFALASLMQVSSAHTKDVCLMTTVLLVLITNLVMGTSMKPLVKLLHIKLARRSELCIFKQMNDCSMEHLTAAVEVITGRVGTHSLLENFRTIDDKWFRPVLLREPTTHDEKIVRMYEKVSMALHLATVNPNHSQLYLNRLYKGLQINSVASKLGDMEVPVDVAGGVEGLQVPSTKVPVEEAEDEDEEPMVVTLMPRKQFSLEHDFFRKGHNLKALRDLTESRNGEIPNRYSLALRRRRESIEVLQSDEEVTDASKKRKQFALRSLSVPVAGLSPTAATKNKFKEQTAGVASRGLPVTEELEMEKISSSGSSSSLSPQERLAGAGNSAEESTPSIKIHFS